MLFPLSRSFSSSRLFQKGVNSEPLPNRVWSIDHTGSRERALELHKILMEKQPYSRHVQMCQQRADEGRRKDGERARAHKEDIRSMYSRADEAAAQGRERQRESAREYARMRSSSEEARLATWRAMADSDKMARQSMEARVRDLPYIWGGEPQRESAERTALRNSSADLMKDKTRSYFDSRKESAQMLAKRIHYGENGNGIKNHDALIEQKKAAGLATLTSHLKSYESTMDAMYAKHDDRVWDERLKKEAEHRQREATKTLNRSLSATSFSESLKRQKGEELAMKERVRTRAKQHAGYQPVLKSGKRLREEAAEQADTGLATLPATMGRSAAVSDQRTLSPRALGLAGGE